jgi:thiol-disulfide isomerase/thioredoxin
MKNNLFYLFILFFLGFSACSQSKSYGEPVEKPVQILDNIMSFLTYQDKYVHLSEEFTALDTASNVIGKDVFLKQISTGNYLPLRLNSKEMVLQLYPLGMSTNEDIRRTLLNLGLHELEFFKMEGTALPSYHFVDLEGKNYTPETTKGKILVLKCWFIHCVPCVQEMPKLNELVKKYESRKDVVFVSLAMDKAVDLRTFLTKKTFNYAVVPEQEGYMVNDLKTNSYPTHIVVNKQGLITKVVNTERDMAVALEKEVAK